MSIAPPSSSLSSQFTSQLMVWRNPHGEEENWLKQEPLPYDTHSLLKRKVITQITTVGLIALSLVETAFVAVYFLYYYNKNKDLKSYAQRVQYVASISLWNLGIFVFNPFCTNLVTNESFFRYSLHKFPTVFQIKMFAGTLGGLYFLISSLFYGSILRLGLAILSARLNNEVFLRKIDVEYLNNWSSRPLRPVLLRKQDQTLPLEVTNLLRPIDRDLGFLPPQIPKTFDELVLEEMNALTKSYPCTERSNGGTVIEQHILNKISDSHTLSEIVGQSPCAYPYILTLTAYIFIYGSKKNEKIPPGGLGRENKEDGHYLIGSMRDALLKIRKKIRKHEAFSETFWFRTKRNFKTDEFRKYDKLQRQIELLKLLIEPSREKFLSLKKFENIKENREIHSLLTELTTAGTKNISGKFIKEDLCIACSFWIRKNEVLSKVASYEIKEEMKNR